MNRLKKNLDILDKLHYYLEANPTIRFGQALSNLNLATHRKREFHGGFEYNDIFYEEPEETLTKMREL